MLPSDTSVCEEYLETRPPLFFITSAVKRNISEKSPKDKYLLDEVVASMMCDPFWKVKFSSDFNSFRLESKVRVGRLKMRLAADAEKKDRDESCSDFIVSEGHSVISVS